MSVPNKKATALQRNVENMCWLRNPNQKEYDMELKEGDNMLSKRLKLDVGGEGVVGRMIKVVKEDGVVVGEGIIGWN